MPKTEKALSTSLKQKLPKKSHYQRIENRAGEGMPDVYMCLDGVPIWLELKIIKSNRVTVNKSQIAWHLGHSRCNGVSFSCYTTPRRVMYFCLTEVLRSSSKVRGSMSCVLRLYMMVT